MTEREQFEAWARNNGLIYESHGLLSVSSGLELLWKVWQAARDQPAQAGVEPVAWGMQRPDGLILDVICPEEHEAYEGEYTTPLYTHPPARVPLTEGELLSMWSGGDERFMRPVLGKNKILAFALAVIAAYEAKNGTKE